MNDNRKLLLGLVSMLAIVVTSLNFLFPNPSPFWVSSQLLMLVGCVLFLGMSLFLSDRRHLKLFALPGAALAIGCLLMVCSHFRLLFDGQGLRMESLSTAGQPMELLAAVACAIELVLLAWTVIDISLDFAFCEATGLALLIGICFSFAAELLCFAFSWQGGLEQVRIKSTECLSTLLVYGTMVVFYLGYTKEQRLLRRYYKTKRAEEKRAALATAAQETVTEQTTVSK